MNNSKKLRFLMLDLKSYYNSPAYQLALLVAYASTDKKVKSGIEFSFSEHQRKQSAEDIAKHILTQQPDLVAISNYAWNHKKICGILDYLTTLDVNLPKIVLGGPNSAGKFGDDMLRRYPIISALVEGEGEPAFKDICLNMLAHPNEDPFLTARNCVIRGEGDIVIRPNLNHRIDCLDETPSPYLEGIIPLHPAPLFYETNRGCPYRCTFCYWGNGNSRVYRMSHERIREEIEFFAKNKVGALFLADANFGIFPDDSDIAQVICDANARYDYPIKFVGVNWAKNSSDRILEIASIFREGKIGVATTLAIQSVTEQAEELSKRYAMPPSRFINLIKNAEERDIDTYTDLIWGLPGESLEEFLRGLEAVIFTGVPSLMIHQLSLLPGTELYDSKEQLGIKLFSEVEHLVPDSGNERSDYQEYIVVSHAKMTYEDMKKGARLLGIAHVLHNHDLGKIVNFYLARYGLGVQEVYTYFDRLMLGGAGTLPPEHQPLLEEIKQLIVEFADGTGNDETIFYRNLSQLLWFKMGDKGYREPRGENLRDFISAFYKKFCATYSICQTSQEQSWLEAAINYNWLLSPKPVWKMKTAFSQDLAFHEIWEDMQAIIFSYAVDEVSAKQRKKNKEEDETDNWQFLPAAIQENFIELLTDQYLEGKSRTVTYQVDNPWRIPPSKTNIDWLLKARSKHCKVNVIETLEEELTR